MITVFFWGGGVGGKLGILGEGASTPQILWIEPHLKFDASGTSLVAGVLSYSRSKETLESWLAEAYHISLRAIHPWSKEL